MCGRFVVARASSELVAELDIDEVGDDLPDPSWNIPPTSRIAIVADTLPRGNDAPDAQITRRLEAASWGLVPIWAKDPSVGVRAFNARSETAADKPTFRAAVAKRRAIVPASGYYEWRKHPDGSKQPFYIHPSDGPLLFAGLYEWWRPPGAGPDEPWSLSATILTRPSAGPLATIHDRMPVFVDPDEVTSWLDPRVRGDGHLVADIADRGAIVAERLEHVAVDPRVGNVRVDDPTLIEPIAEADPT
ncbi:SOS response-associated peptidase [Pseudoclavibacter chungangensis]|uniref:Abasic site processing protein n=1 Tax=Pseudoclavibacter chungangensis TaxID=587635 RepID=A0A7J5BQP6_9MICO|nr:SOS response-associated peptidase [Pseudoclavibacter chungangensis]KAB1656311.1 SOS response-associated peptidase [Pseudoclavibacter chungangensis]NYJ67075.1 putative SOS response-associated peptidase YedK [Pseudoclavibacter chungangensis]